MGVLGMSMLRARFRANPDDYRPIKWPPPGPFWCTGSGEDYSIVVAYVQSEQQLLEFWPEAENIDAEPRDEFTFTSRFERPDWWPADRTTI
jgi:hypothetical protein